MLLSIALLLAPPPAPVQPAKWTVDYADSHCVAHRTFDVGGKSVKLSIKPPLLGGPTRLTISPKITKLANLEPRGSIDFGDGQPPFATTFHAALAADGFGLITDLDEREVARLKGAEALVINVGRHVRGRAETGRMAPLFKALERCLEDLRRGVGVRLPAPPWAQPARPLKPLDPQFTSSRFWTVESRSAKSNRVTVQLLVDKAGDVRECAVVEGSGATGLDIQTCQIFERSIAFAPARDAAGRAVASVVTETIRWRR